MNDTYHTKIIATILEPLSQQISNLIVLYESSSDGRCLPDLRGPVAAVDEAVQRLIRVGQDTASGSGDERLTRQLNSSLQRVVQASRLLRDAAEQFVRDPSSADAKLMLIEGSRGILQGTHDILLAWDESEVRKIVTTCRLLIDSLQPVCALETEAQLVQFIQDDLNTLLPRINQTVRSRADELLDEEERDFLIGEVDRLPEIVEELLAELKLRLVLFITKANGIQEVTDNVALTVDKMTVLLQDVIDMLLFHAITADRQKLLRLLKHGLQRARQVAAAATDNGQSAPDDMVDFSVQLRDCLCECGWIDRPGVEQLYQDLVDTLNSLCHSVRDGQPVEEVETLLAQVERQVLALAVECGDKSRLIGHGAPELQNQVGGVNILRQQQKQSQNQQQQQHRRLATIDDAIRSLRQQPFNAEAAAAACLEATSSHSGLQSSRHPRAQDLVASIVTQAKRLVASTEPVLERQATRGRLVELLSELGHLLGPEAVQASCDAFLDPMGQVKRLVECAERGETDAFYSAADSIKRQAKQLSEAAELVALNPADSSGLVADSARERGARQAAVRAITDQLNRLAPQLANAGRARMLNGGAAGPAAEASAEHLGRLREAWRGAVERLRGRLDRLARVPECLRQLAADVAADSEIAATALGNCGLAPGGASGVRIPSYPQQQFITATSSAARRAHRAVQLLQSDADNCLEAATRDELARLAARLRDSIGEMVTSAKTAASDPEAKGADWRAANQRILDLLGDLLVSRYNTQAAAPNSSSLSSGGSTSSEPTSSPPLPASAGSTASSIQQQHQQQLHQHQSHSRSPTHSLGFELQASQPHASAQPATPAKQQQFYHPPQAAVVGFDDAGGDYSADPADDYAQIDRLERRPPFSATASSAAPPPGGARSGQSSGSIGLVLPEQLNARQLFEEVASSSSATAQATQPILEAARSLHQQVTQYSSEDNEIIAAAEKISLLFARLNRIMNEKNGSKKDLLDTSKAIVEASQNVTRIGNNLASRCTDLSIQGSLLRACQKIPTIGTQLKILTAVKATTMLGESERQQLKQNRILSLEDSSDPEEDQEATEMLVGNARALMDAVSQTVQVAEGASIKIRVDSGIVMKWHKRNARGR